MNDSEIRSGRRALTGVESAVAVCGFPAMMTLSMGVLIVAIERGHDPNLVVSLLIVASYTILAIAERIVPWQKAWLHPHGDLRTDIGLAVFNFFTVGLLGPALLASLAILGAAAADLVGQGLWPTEWPWIAQLALGLVLAEFGEYSFHRSMHEIPALWRFHATHHSAPRLYWLNAARFHPIDLFFVTVFKGIPLIILGAGLPVFAMVNAFSAIHGAYQHSNIPVRVGPLNWIFSLTELHRWHHSKRMEEANHNYGGNLIVWDILFGTRWLPEDRDPPEAIGIEAMPGFPMGFVANLLTPFRWKQVEAEAAPRTASPPVEVVN